MFVITDLLNIACIIKNNPSSYKISYSLLQRSLFTAVKLEVKLIFPLDCHFVFLCHTKIYFNKSYTYFYI